MTVSKKTKRVPVAILARVSTDKQNTARQIQELEQVAAENGWEVFEVIETAGLSGNAKDGDRHDLSRVRELAAGGKIRKVLVHEVSRLARRNSTAHRFLEEMEALGVSLFRTVFPDCSIRDEEAFSVTPILKPYPLGFSSWQAS